MSGVTCREPATARCRGSSPRVSAVSFHCVGCRTNQQEIRHLCGEVRQRGMRVVENPKEADILVVNTCSVTAHAEAKSVRLLRRLHRENSTARIAVTGCTAQRVPGDLAELPGVKWVFGNSEKYSLASTIAGGDQGRFHGTLLLEPRLSLPVALPSEPPETAVRTRFSVKLQEGCDFSCAYCIVPSLRGPSRSARAGDILSCCRRATELGYKELVLTGTHIGQYRDGESGEGLIGLVRKMLELPGSFRIRLSSIDPAELSEELVELVAGEQRMCDHLHLSVQSLCVELLEAMNRRFTDVGGLIDRLRRLRARVPLLGLGGDFIVGFPGETEEMFRHTVTLVERAGFTFGHVFRYSPRPNTPAAKLEGGVPESVKTARALALRRTLARARENLGRAMRGTRQRILIEHTRPLSGLASNYMRVTVPGGSAAVNSWHETGIADYDGSRHCRGERVDDTIVHDTGRKASAYE